MRLLRGMCAATTCKQHCQNEFLRFQSSVCHQSGLVIKRAIYLVSTCHWWKSGRRENSSRVHFSVDAEVKSPTARTCSLRANACTHPPLNYSPLGEDGKHFFMLTAPHTHAAFSLPVRVSDTKTELWKFQDHWANIHSWESTLLIQLPHVHLLTQCHLTVLRCFFSYFCSALLKGWEQKHQFVFLQCYWCFFSLGIKHRPVSWNSYQRE
jgi:hypothetical protein